MVRRIEREEQSDKTDQRCGGKESPRAPRPEFAERDRPGLLGFGDQDSGDEEPREHEEDVDTEKAAGHAADVGMKEDHADNGDGAKAFDVGAESPRAC